ncbi:hypothetical protein [Acidaminobacter hydrogenoformans]|uniref:Uncharacterized protein n=1 Tax=Acidaminobacter hydrogenoformans DSM 2784 TaxID=1120920 RepID=A0A1G5S6H8_9FIRM|nr:hypothetical protein [Acidaminobacter hydrogenoformans]SCZ81982.1 hypothetical protein SAMN03080599_03235 [Acidaminobacter hydrogenoformans DSM 2784]
MRMKAWMLGAMALVVVFGSVWIANALGYWTTESTKTPALIESGEFAGAADPADIRGSYTFGELEAAFGIEVEVLAKAFGVDAAEAEDFQLKSLETIYEVLAEDGTEVGTGSVKYFVSLYTGLPYELTEVVYLPLPAVELLIEEGKVEGEAAEALQAIAVEIPDVSLTGTEPDGSNVESAEESTEESAVSEVTETLLIKGQTTFRDVLDTGVSETEIEAVLGAEMPNPLTVIKTYCTEEALSFDEVKSGLQALVDAQ